MLISATIALTLSPAMCALFLRHGRRPRGPVGWMLVGIDKVRDGYSAVVSRLLRLAVLSLLAIVAAGVGIVLLDKITPTGFLPEEDQGAVFTVVQLPDGASVERTRGSGRTGREADPPDATGRRGPVDRRVLFAGRR